YEQCGSSDDEGYEGCKKERIDFMPECAVYSGLDGRHGSGDQAECEPDVRWLLRLTRTFLLVIHENDTCNHDDDAEHPENVDGLYIGVKPAERIDQEADDHLSGHRHDHCKCRADLR